MTVLCTNTCLTPFTSLVNGLRHGRGYVTPEIAPKQPGQNPCK